MRLFFKVAYAMLEFIGMILIGVFCFFGITSLYTVHLVRVLAAPLLICGVFYFFWRIHG